jgi:diacylglycerol kinase (ATP)
VKPLVILNPSSQGGKTGERAHELERVLARYLGRLDVIHTERPRHAVTMAHEGARQGRTIIVGVGGDGTLHEIVNGVMQARDEGIAAPKIGLVGQGTGGDFRKTLGLEHRLDRYCAAISGGVSRPIDVGRFSYLSRDGGEASGFFLNILSAGMGGLVDEYVAKSTRRFGGTAAYLGASVRALFENEVGLLDCVLHDDAGSHEVAIPTRLIAICNGRYFGGGMEVAPMAVPDDGWLDVVSLGDAPRLRFALSTLAIYRGTHVDNPGVQVFRARAIDIKLRNEGITALFPLDVDGEPLGTLPLRIRLEPGAIELFVPASP